MSERQTVLNLKPLSRWQFCFCNLSAGTTYCHVQKYSILSNAIPLYIAAYGFLNSKSTSLVPSRKSLDFTVCWLGKMNIINLVYL